MANTYRKIYLHVVFAVKNREGLLHKEWRSRLFTYMAATINNRGHYCFAVNGVEDHVHLFFDYKGHELIADLIREVKKSASSFIKNENLCSFGFEWQKGYGVFSQGYNEKDRIIKYVLNQEEHHRKKSFKEEYFQFLNSYEIEFKEEYVFHFLD